MIGDNQEKNENEDPTQDNNQKSSLKDNLQSNLLFGNGFPMQEGNSFGMQNFSQNFNRNNNMNMNFNNNQGMGNYYMQGGMKTNPSFVNQGGYFPKFNNQSQNYSYKKNNFTPYNQNPYQNDEIAQSLKYVTDNYPHLISINNNNIGLTQKVKSQINPRFFVIKSFTEEDIHKSIKYSCWSSTKEGNKKLNNAYEDALSKFSDVFLFFSMNGSGRFVGVCRMSSRVDENMIFEYWAMDEVWKGLIQVEWLFIKDIPNRFLKDIKLSNNAYKPVTNSRDTQEIPRPEGEIMISFFEEFVFQTSILQHFQYYDERQELFEKARTSQKQF